MGEWDGIELDELVLVGDRLTLRPWHPEDAIDVYEAMQGAHMHEFLSVPNPYTREDAELWVKSLGHERRAKGTGLECAIIDSTSNLVGSAGLRFPRPPRLSAEIGYWIAEPARGHGHAAAISRCLAEFGFAHGLLRIEITCSVRNLASAKSALAAGFRFDGTRRADLPAPHGADDSASFSRLATDSAEPVRPAFVPLPAEELSDDVISLRAVEPGDVDAMTAEQNDPVTLAWGFTGVPLPRTEVERSAARAGLEWLVGPAARFSIVDVASGEVAGSMRLRLLGPPNVANIGYGVHPAFRGRGYTGRALRLLVPWAFEQGGFARLELGAKIDNIASRKAALAGGFQPDGVLAARLRNPDGSLSDEARFALVNPRHSAGGPDG